MTREKAKKAKKSLDPAEERENNELKKVASYQARVAKKMNRQKKIRSMVDEKARPTEKKGN